jgi:2-keto-4-pentenoate hydratase/2-oxohepta-3-ene-1,7-dioic acid hydratase in catechol pathway
MRVFINGELLGTDSLANMAWTFEELISYASRGAAVGPGDLLASGTCHRGCLTEIWGRARPPGAASRAAPGTERSGTSRVRTGRASARAAATARGFGAAAARRCCRCGPARRPRS